MYTLTTEINQVFPTVLNNCKLLYKNLHHEAGLWFGLYEYVGCHKIHVWHLRNHVENHKNHAFIPMISFIFIRFNI